MTDKKLKEALEKEIQHLTKEIDLSHYYMTPEPDIDIMRVLRASYRRILSDLTDA